MDTSPHKSGFANVNGIRLHYLDWGGKGQTILFLTGFGSSAHVYDKLAPRFTDKFRVLALTRRGHGDSDYPDTGYDMDTLTQDVRLFLDSLKIEKVILAGHSMANVELCHFAALYPQRILKLIFFDSAFDRSSPEFKAMEERNPINKMQLPGMNEESYSIEEYIDYKKKDPPFSNIWNELMDEEVRNTVMKNPDGRIVMRMSEDISNAIEKTIMAYQMEVTKLKVPVLSIYAILDGNDYLSDYMTEEQKALVREFFDNELPPIIEKCIEQFRRKVPHAKIIEIPKGHHNCFIKHEEIVFDEMRKFLLQQERFI